MMMPTMIASVSFMVFECGILYPVRVGLAGYRVQDSYSVD
jgi:hypothetical protein